MGEIPFERYLDVGPARPAPAPPPTTGGRRLDSIDLLRGLIMVIMALDHVRDYWHHDSVVAKSATEHFPINPVDLNETNGFLFLTRWITHYCAPTFVFLAGTGAFLYGSRGRSRGQLAWFLASRGFWLMLADLTLSRLGWAFQLWSADEKGVWDMGGGIIFVIGAAMVLLSPLVFLPTSAVAALGVAVIAFHNLLDVKTAADLRLPDWLPDWVAPDGHLPDWVWGILHGGPPNKVMELPGWLSNFLHGGKPVELTERVTFGAGYGLLPSLGIMAAGYGLGALYLLDPRVRKPQLLGLGLMLTATFVVLRYSNLYGDAPTLQPKPNLPGPWREHDDWQFTVFSFLNCQKYPFSLMFILMTLGPSITLLGLFEWARGPLARFFVIFGRVPLFFYLLHVPLIHGGIVALDYYRYDKSPQADNGCWIVAQKEVPADYGVDLPMVYVVWAGVVLLLFPLCWWFARVKERYRWWWLSYL